MHHHDQPSDNDPFSDINKRYTKQEVILTHSARRTDELHGLMTLGFNVALDCYDLPIEPADGFTDRRGTVKRIEPDLIAQDHHGHPPHVFFENKLRAVFSSNQPNAYLYQLPDDQASVYFCSAPESAFVQIVNKTRASARRFHKLHPVIEQPDFILYQIDDSQKCMMFITWEAFIGFMYEGAVGLSRNCDEAYLLARQFEDQYWSLTP